MVIFFNKPYYTFSIYMYVILDICVRYASNVHLLVDTVYSAHCWCILILLFRANLPLSLLFHPHQIFPSQDSSRVSQRRYSVCLASWWPVTGADLF
jgi:hypothetical protein